MSAHNFQSDTSRPIVKNPLLSAVAGSIDDFVNNTILLPAAEIPTPIGKPVSAELQSIDRLQRGNIHTNRLSTLGLYAYECISRKPDIY